MFSSPAKQRRQPRAFTLIEILVVIGIIGILMAFLLPALERGREQANNLRCANNLNQIGVGLLIYANDNFGQYPRTNYVPGAPLCAGTNPAAPNPFAPAGPQANDTTAPFFLLLRGEILVPKIFCEPYNDEIENSPDPARDLSSRSNFTEVANNLGYSYANPYPTQAAADAGYALTNKLNPAFAVAADRNPGTGPGKSSRNHENRGQNVLYADHHVEWQTKPNCGVNGDDIYANNAGVVQASPTDATDSVLLPTDR